MNKFFDKVVLYIRASLLSSLVNTVRKIYYAMIGMRIGKGTSLSTLYFTWPHQVSIGDGCDLEHSIIFKFAGIWKPGPSIRIGNNVFIGAGCEFNITDSIQVGDDSLIATGCRFIDHDHGISSHELMRVQQGIGKPILIGKDVWLGSNVIVLKGVSIGDGAIVAAGAVVTKSILAQEIWAGVPARKIGERSSNSSK